MSPQGRAELFSQSGGTAQQVINLYNLKLVRIPLPPVAVQQRIADILSAYDDLIENNTRRIAILEEMARRLFDAEAALCYLVAGQEALRDALPDGWGLHDLGDVLTLQRGFDLPVSDRTPGDVPVFAATGHHGTHNEAKVSAPGIVTGRSGTIGTVNFVDQDFWPLNTTLWVKDFKRVGPRFAYCLLSCLDLKGQASGAAVPTLNRNDVHRLKVALPPADTVQAVEERLEPIFALIQSLQRASENLRAARDLLLPKLISGEIDVSRAALPQDLAAE